MNLTRTQSVTLAIATLALFFGVSLLLIKQSRQQVVPRIKDMVEFSTASSAAPEQSSFVLNNFHRSETRNGKLVWEVDAKRGQYFPETNTAKLEQAKLWLYSEKGTATVLDTAGATLYLKGVGLDKAEAFGGVVMVHNNKVTITTDQAVYDKSNELVTAPGIVKIKGELIEVTGKGLEVKLDNQEARLLNNVESVIRPKGKK